MKKIEVDTLLFDCDGTIVDSLADIAAAVNHGLTQNGLSVRAPEEIRRHVGAGSRAMIESILGQERAIIAPSVWRHFREYFNRHLCERAVLFPGVKETLEHFRHKSIHMVTNRSAGSAHRTLEMLGVRQYFDRIVGAEEGRCLKPAACPILRVGLADVRRAVMIGDSELDIQAGKAAGTLTCAVTFGIGDPELLAAQEPDMMIDRMLDLIALIV